MPRGRCKPLQVWRLADRVRAALAETDAVELAEGMYWYHDAQAAILRRVALPTGMDPVRAIGLTAALSPGCSWNQNLYAAAWLAETPSERLPLVAYKSNVRKALRIYHGEDPAKVLGEKKVAAFFDNLLSPWTSQKVTIDRHAIRVALGKSLSPDDAGKLVDDRVNAYAEFSEAYARVAAEVGLLPSQVQAAVWVHYRNKNGITV